MNISAHRPIRSEAGRRAFRHVPWAMARYLYASASLSLRTLQAALLQPSGRFRGRWLSRIAEPAPSRFSCLRSR